MALEVKVAQKEKLYILLEIKKEYEKQGATVLDVITRNIRQAKAAMNAEDVAYVEKQIEEN